MFLDRVDGWADWRGTNQHQTGRGRGTA